MQVAKRLGVDYREGFFKNRYIGRTFIMPGQAVRKKSVRQKLNALRTVAAIKERWPDIKDFNLHFHNARGVALASVYAALRVMDSSDTMRLQTSIGGMAGCPYCGNSDRSRITSFATPDGRYRVYGCDACQRYLKAYDGRQAPRPDCVNLFRPN